MRRAIAVSAIIVLAACGHGGSAPLGRKIVPRPLPPPSMKAGDKASKERAPSHVVTTVGGNTLGPFLARSGGGALVAWVGSDGNNPKKLYAQPLAPDGEPNADARMLTVVPNETTTLVLRAAREKPGYFAAWSALLDRGEVLSIVALDDKGAPRGPAVDVARTNDHVVWAEIVPTARGAVCVWAEQTRNGDANVLAAAMGGDGKMRGVPSRIAQGVIGWQAVFASKGAAVAVLAPPSGIDPSKATTGALSWIRLDDDARPSGAPLAIAQSAGGDFDVVRAGGAFVLAWTDRGGEDPQVVAAAVDDTGKVQSPKRAVDAVGGGVLEAIAANGAQVVIAWGEPGRKKRASRRVHLAKLASPGAQADDVGVLEVRSGRSPQLAASGAGFAMLFDAGVCTMRPGSAIECPPIIAPTFVRLDAQLAPAQTEPVLFGDALQAAAIAWSLSCDEGERCLALAAPSASPTPISAVDLAPRASSTYVPPVARPRPADAPRLAALKTLAAGAPFADVAATPTSDGALVATITQTVDEPQGDDDKPEKKKHGAVVSVRAYDAAGEPKGAAATTITSRAISVGGVAIAASEKADEGAAIAWVARDAGDLQVHVTKVNASGRRTNEVQLTAAKGEAADVAIAPAPGGGWIVAWVDARDGNGEVYATRIDKDLNRQVREERVTRAPGDAGDVSLLVQGDTAYLAWADPRESPNDGMADVYTTALRTKDCKRLTDDVRVIATAAHSRSPSLAMLGDSPIVAWIEEAPLALDASNMSAYGGMIARLDPRTLKPVREPLHAPVAEEGIATAIVLESGRASVRAFAARSAREEIVIDAFDFGPDLSHAYALTAIEGPPTFEIGMATLGGSLLYTDEGAAQGERRLRRATVTWRK